jgi:hypothetical protein
MIQLISFISLPISTSYYMTIGCTTAPLHNPMISIVSDINTLIIINIDTGWSKKLIKTIAYPIPSSDSDTILYPSSIVTNIRSSCR